MMMISDLRDVIKQMSDIVINNLTLSEVKQARNIFIKDQYISKLSVSTAL